jgi:hypothetical protein
MNTVISSDRKKIIIWGGISALILVAGYIFTFPLYAWVGIPPEADTITQLKYFAEHSTGWWIILGLMVFTDLLYLPIYSALYCMLKKINKILVITAMVLIIIFISFDLIMTWYSHFILLINGMRMNSNLSSIEFTNLVAKSENVIKILSSPYLGILVIICPSLAVFAISIIMVKRKIFNWVTRYLGFVAGISGILFLGTYFVKGLDILRIVNALLLTIWYGFLGFGLLKTKYN